MPSEQIPHPSHDGCHWEVGWPLCPGSPSCQCSRRSSQAAGQAAPRARVSHVPKPCTHPGAQRASFTSPVPRPRPPPGPGSAARENRQEAQTPTSSPKGLPGAGRGRCLSSMSIPHSTCPGVFGIPHFCPAPSRRVMWALALNAPSHLPPVPGTHGLRTRPTQHPAGPEAKSPSPRACGWDSATEPSNRENQEDAKPCTLPPSSHSNRPRLQGLALGKQCPGPTCQPKGWRQLPQLLIFVPSALLGPHGLAPHDTPRFLLPKTGQLVMHSSSQKR